MEIPRYPSNATSAWSVRAPRAPYTQRCAVPGLGQIGLLIRRVGAAAIAKKSGSTLRRVAGPPAGTLTFCVRMSSGATCSIAGRGDPCSCWVRAAPQDTGQDGCCAIAPERCRERRGKPTLARRARPTGQDLCEGSGAKGGPGDARPPRVPESAARDVAFDDTGNDGAPSASRRSPPLRGATGTHSAPTSHNPIIGMNSTRRRAPPAPAGRGRRSPTANANQDRDRGRAGADHECTLPSPDPGSG